MDFLAPINYRTLKEYKRMPNIPLLLGVTPVGISSRQARPATTAAPAPMTPLPFYAPVVLCQVIMRAISIPLELVQEIADVVIVAMTRLGKDL